ncbi:MAG: ribosome silencing factor [Gammaproteobacteria bacterium]|nr:MAG: ribosome silencing factor [Gammaproteobacteria bacterium]
MTKLLTAAELKDLALASIEELKAQDITVLDVRGKASFTDFMIVASGTSDRHLKAMSNQIHIDAKAAGNPPLSTEGEDTRNWILVDLGDVIVHLMRPEVREMYEIEKLWRIGGNMRTSNHSA